MAGVEPAYADATVVVNDDVDTAVGWDVELLRPGAADVSALGPSDDW